jgi:hypothetical protein
MKIELDKQELLDLVKALEHYRTFDNIIESICLEDLIFKFEDGLLNYVEEDDEDESEDDECGDEEDECCCCCSDDDEAGEDFDYDEVISATGKLCGLPECTASDYGFEGTAKLKFEFDSDGLVLRATTADDIVDTYGPIRTVKRTGKTIDVCDTGGSSDTFSVKKFPKEWTQAFDLNVTYRILGDD